MSIYQKLLEVKKELPIINKNGLNTFHKYKYVTESDILETLNPILAAFGVGHHVTVITADVQTMLHDDNRINQAFVNVLLQLTDVDNPTDSVMSASYGYAEDKNGDKALYKAITGATKYAYLKTFGLTTGEDDPENDSPVKEAEERLRKQHPLQKHKDKEAKIEENRQAVLNDIGQIFAECGFSRSDFPDIEALQNPNKAKIYELEKALKVVKEKQETVKAFINELEGKTVE